MDEMPLSINLDKSRSRRIKANRFTNREIREALDTPGYLDKKQTTGFATELPRRASFSLACIVFALIGVPLVINTRRKDTSTGFALGILIASLYFLALIFCRLVPEKRHDAPLYSAVASQHHHGCRGVAPSQTGQAQRISPRRKPLPAGVELAFTAWELRVT